MSTEISMEERVAALEAQVATLMVKEVKVKKVASPAKIKVVPVLTGEEPTAEDYRLDEVDATLCQGRKLKTEDKRWSPAVYHESQCQGKPSDDGLCTGCASLLEKETEAGKFKRWNGRVGEDPLDHVHMLGSAWAEKCKWNASASASAAASPAAAEKPEKAAAEKPKADVAAKAAAKEAEKAAKAAAKEAEKAAKAAAKEAEKAAAKAAKEAAAGAAKAVKAAKEKPKKESPKKAKTVAVAATEAPISGDHDIMLIDGEMRAVKNGNVYEMDELTQEPGDFIGRLTGTKDAPSIDPDAEEEVESDTD
jgi:hypothetical protein